MYQLVFNALYFVQRAPVHQKQNVQVASMLSNKENYLQENVSAKKAPMIQELGWYVKPVMLPVIHVQQALQMTVKLVR